MPSGVRTSVCDALGLQPDEVPVVVGDVRRRLPAMKTGAYPKHRGGVRRARAQAPVEVVRRRMEEFLSAVHGRDVVSHCRWRSMPTASDLACVCRRWATTGAYATGTGILIPLVMAPG